MTGSNSQAMTISVQGIGWFTKKGFGCVRIGRQEIFHEGGPDSVLLIQGLFSHPYKNLGRLDAVSRTASYAVALALRDAEMGYSPQRKQQVGIVGTNREGSLRTDLAYFQDYIQGGRKLSRANLFIYTLPSSALGEAAIHFGFLGPVLYAASDRGSLSPVLDLASGMIEGDEAAAMLAGTAGEEEALFMVIGRHSAAVPLCSVDDARQALATPATVSELVRRFSLVRAGKGFA